MEGVVNTILTYKQSAYETLYSLLEAAPSRMDIVSLYDRIVTGSGDEQSIRTLCNLMVSRLIVLAPEETVRRLDELVEQYRKVMSVVLKDTAVRHEHERADEAKKSVVKVALELSKAFSADAAAMSKTKWTTFLDDLKKDHATLVKEVETESKEKERA